LFRPHFGASAALTGDVVRLGMSKARDQVSITKVMRRIECPPLYFVRVFV
jgi:hypothetical protein